MNKNVNERPACRLSEFDKYLIVASHFGFLPIDAPKVNDKDIENTSDCGSDPHYHAAEKAAFLRTYLEKDLSSLPHPLGVVYKRSKTHTLELVGFPIGLAEAILIRTSLSMLMEAGHKHLVVDINCIGDKESIGVYERELHNYLRRAGTDLPAEFKKELKRDVFGLIKHPAPELVNLRQSAPTSISYLSTSARNYFKEVLEYIEALEIDFRLTPELVGDKNYCSHTIFNIKGIDEEKENLLAVGYCYNRLGKRFGFKKEVPLAGVNVFTEHKSVKTLSTPSRVYKGLPRPKFYLIQLGREARMKSLSTIEMLRRERIPVHHSVGKDKLTIQLSNAESTKAPYLLIIGHKEALENTVTIRNTSNRAQETVSITELVPFLKNLPL
jgi:histidyl-tRNA synthetase